MKTLFESKVPVVVDTMDDHVSTSYEAMSEQEPLNQGKYALAPPVRRSGLVACCHPDIARVRTGTAQSVSCWLPQPRSNFLFATEHRNQ